MRQARRTRAPTTMTEIQVSLEAWFLQVTSRLGDEP